ncbi:MAG TPA: hypothetical protein VF155_01575 [Candidatus Dormibacteraeota bacterium]
MRAPAGTCGTAMGSGFGVVGGAAMTGGGGAGPPAGRAAPELPTGATGARGRPGVVPEAGVAAASTACDGVVPAG